jgi:anaerobic selenocysteine-containing dehydrogenase
VIKVYLQNGEIRHIQGTCNHPMNKGTLCAKRNTSIMKFKSSARLLTPSSGSALEEKKLKKVKWTEALDIATVWLARCYAKSPRKLTFFTGRDQSQSLASW